MNLKINKKILIALLLLGLIVGCKDPFTPDKTEIIGIIRDTDSNPIADVTITLSPGDTKLTTGADGYYTFTNIRPNTYTIKAKKTGVGEKSITVKVESTTGLSCYNLEKVEAEVIILDAGVTPDKTHPTVEKTSPTEYEENVTVNTSIEVSFSKTMNIGSISTMSFLLYEYETTEKKIDGTINFDSTITNTNTIKTKAIFKPLQDLSQGTKYKVRLTNNISDRTNLSLSDGKEWYFTTQ